MRVDREDDIGLEVSPQTFDAVRSFAITGSLKEIKPLKRGHINDTYISCWQSEEGEKNYIHQRINHHVFIDIPQLMKNFVHVTDHVRSKINHGGEPGECTLRLVHTAQGSPWHQAQDGSFWRTLDYVSGTISYDCCTNENIAFEAARAFGRFQRHLTDLDPSCIHEIIPFFHHTPTRFDQLKTAIKLDPLKRAKLVSQEIAYAMEREKEAALVANLVNQGRLLRRVIHYDTKLNNVLFNHETGKAICVIDLDTCMPGCVLYDFGDLVRSTGVSAREDEHDLEKVEVDENLFRALAEGYLASVADYWEDLEVELMYFAPKLIALTLGIRFLADFLMGDHYFKIRYPEHNMRRTRAQLKIARSMEEKEDTMKALVARVSHRF
jgi:hypothetical protein